MAALLPIFMSGRGGGSSSHSGSRGKCRGCMWVNNATPSNGFTPVKRPTFSSKNKTPKHTSQHKKQKQYTVPKCSSPRSAVQKQKQCLGPPSALIHSIQRVSCPPLVAKNLVTYCSKVRRLSSKVRRQTLKEHIFFLIWLQVQEVMVIPICLTPHLIMMKRTSKTVLPLIQEIAFLLVMWPKLFVQIRYCTDGWS